MLTHHEFDQIKRAIDRMRTTESSSNSYTRTGTSVEKVDVIEILLPYVEGFQAPNPHPAVDKGPGFTASPTT